jgi:hypothetical protein
MKKILIGVSVILGMASCTKEEVYYPTSLNPHLKINTQAEEIYLVNVGSLPQVESISCDYKFYGVNYQGDTLMSSNKIFIPLVEFTDEWSFYVTNNSITSELQIEEIY